ncbi:MAG: hypothetical protein ACE5OZ_05025 [Candidatus Heimdallarchaeota archaeon]
MSEESSTNAETSREKGDSLDNSLKKETVVKNSEIESSKKKAKKKAKPEKPSAFRALKFEWHAFRAEMKHVWRMVKRELKYYVNPVDVVIIVIMYLFIVILVITTTVALIPAIVAVFNPTQGKDLSSDVLNFWLNSTGGRMLLASGGLIVFFVRLVVKSDLVKFKNKVNSKNFPLTYVFGTSSYAEYLIRDITKLYGEEEQFVLIADKDLIWVRQARGLMDVYIVENREEFLKENFYEILTFQNAQEFLILTDEVELNQAILTHVRGLRDFKHVEDLPKIIMLSETAPSFLKHRNLEDENIILLDDLSAITDGLVLSLSLDIQFPRCIEFPAVKSFVGWPAVALSNHVKGFTVLAIKRQSQILPPGEAIQAEDKLIIYAKERGEHDTKRTRRITQELPAAKKKVKK